MKASELASNLNHFIQMYGDSEVYILSEDGRYTDVDYTLNLPGQTDQGIAKAFVAIIPEK